jgi:hypothetical protein
MEAADGKLKLVMKSEKVARIVEYEVPLMTYYGKVGSTRRRARVYDYVFDERQMRALREARELASKTGLVLEVTDLTRQNALKRVIRLGFASIGHKRTSPLVFSGSSKTAAGTQDACARVNSPACLP